MTKKACDHNKFALDWWVHPVSVDPQLNQAKMTKITALMKPFQVSVWERQQQVATKKATLRSQYELGPLISTPYLLLQPGEWNTHLE